MYSPHVSGSISMTYWPLKTSDAIVMTLPSVQSGPPIPGGGDGGALHTPFGHSAAPAHPGRKSQ